jgi:nucleotide-binding universal stress UspA family protein
MSKKRILFAVDDSPYARKALDMVLMIHRAEKDDHVVVLHVIEPIPALIGNPMRENLRKEMIDTADKIIAGYTEELARAGIECSTRVEQGEVAPQIILAAENEKCDMIVLGARGESSLEEFLLGAVSGRVVQHSRISVLIAR